MRAPEPALIRARAKAPLRDLQVLHLSNAGLECIANLEQCRHALRSLYAGENRLRDLDGLLVLRRLWRIDLSDNSLCSVNGKSPLHPLASLPALGFLCVERNQLCFEDLVCLRDMNIMEIRLQGNPTLHQDRSVLVEYHMKVAALLPNVWILDGHYISVREREHAIDEANEFVVYFLEKAKRSNDSVNAGKFGSTTDLWGGLSIASGGADEARIAVRNENVPRLVEHIHTQRTRNPDSEDRYRLQIIIALHNEESAVHNAHCKFAPSKFSRNARIMPRIPLRELFALPRRTRTEVATTLAAHLEYPMPKALLLEALTIQVLDYGELLTNAVEDLVSMPPYALSALLCLLRHHAMEEGETLQQELKLGISSCTPDSHSENTLWA
uniref:U2A'/phosphoprotein 32 family A C-terminal domain-containing protein n=1 Tax=Globisporangium ultimum (strain ATCC 200006 / CBS 805.95 / DAOM BR144) TaxID=431595 RepID=K3XAB8_GLOUD